MTGGQIEAVATDGEECARGCGFSNYTYGGRWKGEFCFCGNTLPNSTTNDSTCNVDDRILVYQSIIPTAERYSPIEVMASKILATVDEQVEITVNLPPGISNVSQYTISYGDVLAKEEVVSDITKPLTLQYSRVGSNWPTVYAKNSKGLTIGAGGVAVQIVEKLTESDVVFKCPEETVVGMEIWCNLTLKRGSHMIGIVQYGTRIGERFTLAEPGNDWIRQTSDRLSGSLTTCPAGELWISGTQARYTSVVTEIDLNAVNTGNFDLLLLRPDCASGTVYNFDEETCSAPTEGIDCKFGSNSNIVYSAAVQACVIPGKENCSDNLHSLRMDAPTNLESYGYVVVEMGVWSWLPREAELLGYLDKTGQTKIKLTLFVYQNDYSTVIVESGIVVGDKFNETELVNDKVHSKENTLLRLKNHTGIATEYVWDFGDGTGTESTTIQEVQHTYTASGSYNLTVNMSNRITFITVYDTVTVQERMTFTGISASDTATTDAATSITLDTNSGGDLFSCDWYADGSLEIEYSSFPVGSSTSISFLFKNGSELEVELKINGITRGTTVDYVKKRIISEALDQPDPVEVDYAIVVKNPLNSETVSGKCTFDIPVEGLVVYPSPRIGLKNDPIKFQVQLIQGTSVKLSVDYGDGQAENQSIGKLVQWPGDQEFSHSFAAAKVYNTTFYASSGSRKLNFSVLVPIQGITGNYSLNCSGYFGTNKPITLGLTRIGGDEAVHLDITVVWGDSTPDTVDQFNEGDTYTHTYSSEGDFTITVTLGRSTAPKTANCTAKIRNAIEDFVWTATPNPVKVGGLCAIRVDLRSGKNVTIHLNLKNGSLSETVFQEEAATVQRNYTYLTAGIYNETIWAGNDVGSVSQWLTIDVRKPVTKPNVTWFDEVPGSEGVTTINIAHNGSTTDFPNGVVAYINWGDGSETEKISLENASYLPRNFTHSMKAFNYLTVNVTFDNLVSSQSYVKQIAFFTMMISATVNVTVASNGYPGYGPKKDKYPGGIPLRLMVSPDRRTDNVAQCKFVITYQNTKDQVLLDWASGNAQEYTFDQGGPVQIDGFARNPYSQVSASTIIDVSGDLRGMNLVVLGTIMHPGRATMLNISFEAISNETYICVEKNDKYGSVVYLPDDSTTPSQCPSFKKLRGRPENNLLYVDLQYENTGDYNISVTASNPRYTIKSKVSVSVVTYSCGLPRLELIKSPAGTSGFPIEATVGEICIVETKMAGDNCNFGHTSGITWRLYKLDGETLAAVRELDISNVASAKTLTLRIPEKMLTENIYRATLIVSINVEGQPAPITATLDAYIQALKPAPLISLHPGNPYSMEVGMDDPEVCFSPEQYSYDPSIFDRNAPQGLRNWKWYCAKKSEKFTENIVQPKPAGFNFPRIRLGCFGDGSGRLNTSAGSICFPTSNLEIGTTYKLKVQGSSEDGERTSEVVVNLVPVRGTLLEVQIIWSIKFVYQKSEGTFFSDEQLEPFTKGLNQSTLYVSKSLFTEDADATGIIICALISRGGQNGSACMKFSFLGGPKGGECWRETNGTTTLICKNFSSDLGQLNYMFYLNSTPKVILGTTEDGRISCGLPITGAPVRLCVLVSDTFGGAVDKCFDEIDIRPPDVASMKSKILSLLNESNVERDKIALAGNDTQKASMVYTYAAMINQLRISEESNTTYANATEQKAIVDQNRNERSEALGQLVRVIATVVPVSPSTLILSASTIQTVLTNKDDIAQESQKDLVKSVQYMASALPELVKGHSPEMQKQSVTTVTGSVLSLFETMNSQLDNPVPLDLPTAPRNMDYEADLEAEGVQNSADIYTALSRHTAKNNETRVVHSAIPALTNMLKAALDILRPMSVDNGDVVEAEAPSGKIGLRKIRGSKVGKIEMSPTALGSTITTPELCSILRGNDCNRTLIFQSMTTPVNIYSFVSRSGNGIPTSPDSETVSLSIYGENGVLPVNRTKEPFDIIIKKASGAKNVVKFAPLSANETEPKLPKPRKAVDGSEVYQALLMSKFEIPEDNSGFTFQLKPINLTACPQYLAVIGLIDVPRLDREDRAPDYWTVLPEDTSKCVDIKKDPNQEGYPYTVFLNSTFLLSKREEARSRQKALDQLTQAQLSSLYVGIRELNEEERDKYTFSNPPPRPYPYRDQINQTAYSRAFLSACLSIVTENPKIWSSAGCIVGPRTTALQTHCLCNHLSTFASGWLAMPNELDFNYIFSNMDFSKNATLYAVEIAVALLFLLIFIWARRADLKDMAKLGVTPLAENSPKDEYLYEIIVSTGRRRGAGTDSNVCFVLSGEYGETDPKVLRDPERPILKRGCVNRFLMACPRPLGSLIYCRLWHDNSGEGDRASWYCNYLGVVDLQTREEFHFIIERWFAVEEDDGQVDRLIPVSSQEEMLAFSHMFATNVSRKLTEDHLWLSVVTRSPSSHFTRVERAACCLMLLFLSMLTSCMFYKDEGAEKQPNLVSFGPFAISAQEIFVAVINNLITFAPSFLVPWLFRNSRLYTSHAKKLRQAVEDQLEEKIDFKKPQLKPKAIDTPEEPNDITDAYHPVVGQPKRQKSDSCPWQLRILAWIILLLSLAAGAAFTTFYGISFGDAACKKWLSSIFLSFFTNVILTQPIKVMLLAMFFACVCKKTENAIDIDVMEEEDELIEQLGRRYQLRMDEEYLHNEYLMANFKPRKLIILPPDPTEIERARAYRLKQRKANDVMREVIFYSIFFVLLLVVTTGFRDPNATYMRRNLQTTFFPAETFDNMRTVKQFYVWVEKNLIPGLRASRWYNNDPQIYQRGYLADRTDRIIGYCLMRQLRVRSDSCIVVNKMRPLFKDCYASYDISTQDEEPYGVGWTDFQGDLYSNNSSPEYWYHTSSQLNGMVYLGDVSWYAGGGYVHALRGSKEEMLTKIQTLKSQNWIDFKTRAMIIQLTTYNPNVNLFAIITVLVEKPGIGSLIPHYRIEIANLLGNSTQSVQTAFQVLYVFALICYLVKEMRNIYKSGWRYFKSFWTFTELFIIIGSIAAIAAFAYMTQATTKHVNEFSRTHGTVFMNFQFLAYWNEALVYLTACICFFATLKMIRLLRFNKHIGLFGSVMSYAWRDMRYFFLVFGTVFLAFVIVFYLLYSATLKDFRSFLASMETSLQIILGKFDFTAMYEREMILGPLMFATFTLVIIFVMVSMFVAILDESFQKVMEDVSLQSDDHDITEFIMSQLVSQFGLGNTGWGRKIVNKVRPEARSSDEESERDLSKKLAELTRMMDEFLSYVQVNHLADDQAINNKLMTRAIK
ncbi:unnamed protein product [Calicophoron daubneyi]|uniref:PKD1 n=1 Tax=Calicophoron daubneyi TaxID=300641 RepID=A0AAV2U0B7_CALDB